MHACKEYYSYTIHGRVYSYLESKLTFLLVDRTIQFTFDHFYDSSVSNACRRRRHRRDARRCASYSNPPADARAARRVGRRRDVRAFGLSGLCDGPLPDSLLLADLSHRCVRLLSPSPLEPSAAAFNSADSSTSSTSSTARVSARVRRDWTQSSVYSAATDRNVLAIASRTSHRPPTQQSSPPDEIPNSGGGGGAEVVTERIRGRRVTRARHVELRRTYFSMPLKYCTRVRWWLSLWRPQTGSRSSDSPIHALSSVPSGVSFARRGLTSNCRHRALERFQSVVSAPPVVLTFRHYYFHFDPHMSSPDNPQLVALFCHDDLSIRLLLVCYFLFLTYC